jgi:hypothetical protein
MDIGDGNVSDTLQLSLDGQTWMNTIVVWPSLPTSGQTLFFTAVDRRGNRASATSYFFATVDTTAPTVTLQGNATMLHEGATPFVDPGATAVDSFEGSLNTSLSVSALVDGARRGALLSYLSAPLFPAGTVYSIEYSASDSSGNRASIACVVTIIDTTLPTLELNGSSIVQLDAGKLYTDAPALCLDSLDGPLSVSSLVYFTPDQSVNAVPSTLVASIYAVGQYAIVYSCVDRSGNAALPTNKTVIIVDSDPPVISIIGEVNISVNVGSQYIDLFAINEIKP